MGLGRIFLSLSFKIRKLRSEYRKFFIRFLYNVDIDHDSHISRNVKVITKKNSSIKIKNTYISEGTVIESSEDASVEIEKCFIGLNCVIVSRSGITIRENTQIAEFVVIRDQDHLFHLDDSITTDQGFNSSPITIGSNVWVGCKSTILKGVTIGNNVVLGAHSLANKNLEQNSLYVGTPCRKIK